MKRVFGILIVLLVLPSLALAQDDAAITEPQIDVTISPGKVFGNIVFSNNCSALDAYLASSPVVNHPPINPPPLRPVRLYQLGEASADSTNYYTPENVPIATSGTLLATFDINPNVEDSGSTFVLGIDKILFSDGSSYRFGSLETSSPWYQQCPGVLPTIMDPTGTECNINECAQLLTVPFRLIGAADGDLDALSTGLDDKPVCDVNVWVEENPGSGDFHWQASSGQHVFDVTTLTGSGESISLPIRGVGGPIVVKINCTVKVKPGETGFVIIPQTGRTPVGASFTMTVPDCTSGCGEYEPDEIVGILIERRAGGLRGFFDISDHTELMGRVTVETDLGEKFWLDPPLTDASSLPTVMWEFDGIPEGEHLVYANGLTDGGKAWLNLPHKNLLNRRVVIERNHVTELGSTFITKPSLVQGKMFYRDPGGLTDLAEMNNIPFEDINETSTKTYIHALGDSSMLQRETTSRNIFFPLSCTNSTSGINASAAAILEGVYDDDSDRAELSYSLPLGGLSPRGGNVNGEDTCPAPWEIDSVSLGIIKSNNEKQSISLYLPYLLSYISGLDSSTKEPLHYVGPDDQRICFGKLSFTINISPEMGSMYAPNAFVRSNSITFPEEGDITLQSVIGTVWGIPINFNDRASEIKISATVPSGTRYSFDPSLMFVPPGGVSRDATWMQLGSFTTQGIVGCGSYGGACIDLNDDQGNYSIFSIELVNDPGTCHYSDGAISYELDVLSQGTNVAYVGYEQDVTDPANVNCEMGFGQALCSSNCGPDPSYQLDLDLSGLSLGLHNVVFCAISPGGCHQKYIHSFEISDQVDFECPEDIVVRIPEEAIGIDANDPCIADQLLATGGVACQPDITPENNMPDNFPLGETTINYWLNSQTCSTNVNVFQQYLHAFTYTDTLVPPVAILREYTIENDTSRLLGFVQGGTWLEYSPNGSKIGVAQKNDTDPVVVIDPETINFQNANQGVNGATNADNLAFRPEFPDQYVAVTNMGPNSYMLELYEGPTPISYWPLSLPGLNRPEIAWRPDGKKLAVALTFHHGPPNEVNGFILMEYGITDTAFGSPREIFSTPPSYNGPNEDLSDIVYADDHSWIVATNRGISRVNSGSRVVLKNMINYGIDLTPDGDMAAYVRLTENSFEVGLVGELLSGNPMINQGLNLSEDKGRVAISSDKKYIAFTHQGVLKIYEIPEFTLVKEITGLIGPFAFEPVPEQTVTGGFIDCVP